MLQSNNTQPRLPYGMSHVTDPAYILAGEFLYSQYPGIYKLRIGVLHLYDRKGVRIRLISTGTVRRYVDAGGYSLGNAVSNLIRKIKADQHLTERLRHPEKFNS